jgi:hypothetical protein
MSVKVLIIYLKILPQIDTQNIAKDLRIRRRKIGQIYLYRRNFIGGFYGASERFLTPRKTDGVKFLL